MITRIDSTESLLRAIGLHPQPRRTAGLAPASPRAVPAGGDRVEISPEAERAARAAAEEGVARVRDEPGADRAEPQHFEELTDEEQGEVRELRTRDRAVRSHEQAHKAADGSHAGPISLTFVTGPDGRRYATGGEVAIDLSPVEGDPDATVRKMQQVRRAALAPGEPSPQDRAVAARAGQLQARARSEVRAAERGDGTTARAAAPAPHVRGRLVDVTA